MASAHPLILAAGATRSSVRRLHPRPRHPLANSCTFLCRKRDPGTADNGFPHLLKSFWLVQNTRQAFVTMPVHDWAGGVPTAADLKDVLVGYYLPTEVSKLIETKMAKSSLRDHLLKFPSGEVDVFGLVDDYSEILPAVRNAQQGQSLIQYSQWAPSFKSTLAGSGLVTSLD
ncbi:MAG: hypothetical protein M1829_004167 [Trizodia sp. TS-e1964]|nr:MAG: hypothetical protein M1829_004167 [Trizodia sp. TS-e1964]